jgi:hypothetical protein
MLILALAAALAASGPIEEPLTTNADADEALEQLVPDPVKDEFGFEQRRVVLEDDCGSFVLLPVHDTIASMSAREIDGATKQREILVEGRSGASSRAGMTRVLRFTDCKVRALFAYDSNKPRYKAPRGWYVAAYGVRVRRGRLTLDEYLARDDKPAVTASRRRTSVWRYAKTRFVRTSVRFGKP